MMYLRAFFSVVAALLFSAYAAHADTSAKFFPLERDRPVVRALKAPSALPLRAPAKKLPPMRAAPPLAIDMNDASQPKEMLHARTLLAIFSAAER